MSKIRLGIVGLGGIAQKVYLPFLSAEKDWTLSGAYSPTEAKRNQVCSLFRVRAFSSLPALLDGSDAVFVSSSTESHFEVVSEAFRHGKDVYVDKPLASTVGEAEQLVEMSVKCGRKLMVGFNRRFAPMYVRAKESSAHPSFIRIEKHRADSVRSEDCTATLLDDYIHVIDTARWLGEPDSYGSVGGSITVNAKNELIFARNQYDSNGTGVFTSMHRKAGTNMERLEIISDGRLIRVRDMDTIETEENGRIETAASGAWDTVLRRKGFEGAILHFIRSIVGGTAPIIDGEEALKSQMLLDAIVKESRYYKRS